MKKIFFYSFLFIFSWIFISCNNESSNTASETDSTVTEENVYKKTGNFYATENNESLIIADPIIYDVIVKNPNPDDEWMTMCLENADIQALQNIIYNAVYQGKLIPYHYRLDTLLSIEYVKLYELENKDEQVAKILFEEQWFFNENTFEMYKKVNNISIGYELKNENGEVYGYKGGFKVYFDEEHNKQVSQ